MSMAGKGARKVDIHDMRRDFGMLADAVYF